MNQGTGTKGKKEHCKPKQQRKIVSAAIGLRSGGGGGGRERESLRERGREGERENSELRTLLLKN